MVKILAHNDLIIKKSACFYITVQANANPDLSLLAVNTLVKDCADSNPYIRGLALKTLCSIQHLALTDYVAKALLSGLKDRSAYVRRVAVTGCGKISVTSHEFIEGNGVVDLLYGMLRDTDPIVVINCMHTLDEILKDEGGIVINKNITYYLLNKLSMFTEWGVVTIFEKLLKYKPKKDEETYDILNILDPYLKHNNSAILTSAIKLFLHLVHDLPQLKGEVFNRAQHALIHSLSSGNPELAFMIVDFVEEVLSDNQDLFAAKAQSFFCKYNEPLYVKLKKITLLPKLISESNIGDVIEELSMHCSDVSPEISKVAIKSLSDIALKYPQYYALCLKRLLLLLDLQIDYVTSNVLGVLQSFDFQSEPELAKAVMESIAKCSDYVDDSEGKSSLIYLLGEYGEFLEDSPYILEEFVDTISEETSHNVKYYLLSSLMKLFFKRPAECQDILGRVLEHCASDDNLDVSDRAKLYYSMLQHDVKEAQRVVMGEV
ncbi:AP-4 complex subunit beta-1-like isoform X2 [Lineus longissimus]